MPPKNSGGSTKFPGGHKVIRRTAQTAFVRVVTPRHPLSPASKSGFRLPIHVFNSVCLGLVPGQIDSPYLIIMP